MSSVNKVILLGNLGKDPEIRHLPNGDTVATFSIATSEKWTGKDGQAQERTEWHRVEVYGKTAEVAQKYLGKGSRVYVEGAIRYEEWEKDGVKRNATKVRLSGPNSRLVLLGGDRKSAPKPAEYEDQAAEDRAVADADGVPF